LGVFGLKIYMNELGIIESVNKGVFGDSCSLLLSQEVLTNCANLRYLNYIL